MHRQFLLAIVLATTAAAQSPDNRWLDTVRTFADKVLAHGRDTYGPRHTPLFVDGINLDTGDPVEWIYGGARDTLPIPKRNKYELFEVQRRGDRWLLSDLANQQTLFRTLDALSTLTGDPRYREAAVAATRYAFRHLQSRSGAMYWGAHIAYDVRGDVIVIEQHMHELKFHLPHYPLMLATDRSDALAAIAGFWDINVRDWQTLDIDRHGDHLNRTANEFPWRHAYHPVPPPFPGEGLSFCGTGCDLMLAAIEFSLATGQRAPREWAMRLASRYADARDPTTGLVGYQFTIPADDRARAQFGPGRSEATIMAPGMARFRYARMAVCWFYFADMLGGDDAEYLRREALRDLRAFATHIYQPDTNRVVPVLTDGTRIDIDALTNPGYYYDPAEDRDRGTLRISEAKAIYFRAFATAWRVTGGRDATIREMTRTLARHHRLGEIGASLDDYQPPRRTKADDPHLLYGALELHRASGNRAYLDLARTIADNILARSMQKGYFTPRTDHLNARFDCDEPLALLHLHAALNGSPAPLPTPWPATPYFRCTFEGKGRGNDTQLLYDQRRQ